MSNEFSAQGKSARELIPVPDLAMESIRIRSRAARTHARAQALIACAAISIGAIGAGAVGSKLYDGVRVWLAGDKAAIRLDSFESVFEPMASDVRAAAAHATFPVVFPVGIPAGSRVRMLTVSPPAHPRAIIVSYENHAGGDGPGFVLLDPAVFEVNGAAQIASAQVGPAYDWRVGGEVVLAGRARFSLQDRDRVKTAMLQSSPRESLAAIDTMVFKIMVLGRAERVEVAERSAPRSGRSVLLAQYLVRTIPRLVKSGAPIIDRRAARVVKVPYVNGQFDYRHMRAVPGHAIGVPANGVRAIGAVLRSTVAGGDGGDCKCEIMFNQPNSAAYWVWKIPMSGPPTVKKYAVDARTFAVTPIT